MTHTSVKYKSLRAVKRVSHLLPSDKLASLQHVYQTAVNVTPFWLPGAEFIFKAINPGGKKNLLPPTKEPESSNITMFYTKVQLIRTLNNMNRVPKLITTSISFFHLCHSPQNGLSTSRFPIKMLYTFS